MPVTQALMIALSGFLVVFIMLMILMALLVVSNKLINRVSREEPEMLPVHQAPVQPEPVKETAHQIYGGEIALYDVDEKTAACIMAIVSDSTKIPLENLIFKSIRAVD
jgi:Na+-transporting methylmalonyl-CoA/oxaloacetate decarboxylase gamma subunit